MQGLIITYPWRVGSLIVPGRCIRHEGREIPLMGKRKSSPKQSMRRSTTGRWSQKVTQESDALDLEEGVFTLKDPKRIARSLKRSAEASKRRKADPYRSAMSMLTFYINRAGSGLPAGQRATLEKAKDELRVLYRRA
jgi:hypothetical protein